MIQCTKSLKMKKEFKVIADLLTNNTRVLDVGCGDGTLMNFLKKEKNIEVRGLELNQDNVQQCINKGLPVIQGNAETELHQFPNQSFDYVILSQTLQAFYDPEKVVDLQGTVTRFVFRNPHAFLFIDVPDENGQNSEWQIELGAPVGLRRIGWTPDTLPVGMEVQLTGRGSRAEGSQGVCCVRMTRADGTPVLEGGAVRERTQD